MTKNEKLFMSFSKNPCSLSYADIEKILLLLGFEKTKQKGGSHIKFRYGKDILIFSPHNGNIKPYQKEKALKLIQKLNLLSK